MTHAGQEPITVSGGDSMKVLLGPIVTSKSGNLQASRNVLRKERLQNDFCKQKVGRKPQAITLSAGQDEDAAGL